MTKRPTKRTGAEPSKSDGFLDALKFLSLVTADKGTVNETHIILGNNTATANNGIISAGVLITEDIYAGPNNSILIEALSKCGEHLSITQLDTNRLSIKSNKFKAVVPCIDQIILTPAIPDPNIAVVDDRFKIAMDAIDIVPEHDDRITSISILMNGPSLVVTNGYVMFEYWHGIDLPYGLAIPKAFATPLIKAGKAIKGFGCSRSSVTFYFEDDSWFKTQLCAGEWPNVGHILNQKCNAFAVPTDFFKALEAVAPFSADGQVYFDKDILRSHATDATGASYEIPGLPKGPVYPSKQLALLKPWAETIDFVAPGPHNGTYMLMAYGSNMRGGIMGRANA